MFTFSYTRAELVAHLSDRARHHADRAESYASRARNLREKGPAALEEAMADMIGDGFDGASYGQSTLGLGNYAPQSMIGSQIAALTVQLNLRASGHREEAKKFSAFSEHVPHKTDFDLTLEELREFEFVEGRGPAVGYMGRTGGF